MAATSDGVRWAVLLSVARPGGWRAWAEVGGDFERALAAQASESVLEPRIEAVSRRGAEWVRVKLAMTVIAADVGAAAIAAWWVFRKAADDGWDMDSAMAEVRPLDPLAARRPGRSRKRVPPTARHAVPLLRQAPSPSEWRISGSIGSQALW